MPVTAIPQGQWEAFADQFSRQHRGWLVTVEATDSRSLKLNARQAGAPSRVLAHDEVLREVALEQGETPGQFRILVGQQPGRLVHRIRRPLEVRFEVTDDGAHQGLWIDDADGTTTCVRFRTPAQPEVLDGISQAEW